MSEPTVAEEQLRSAAGFFIAGFIPDNSISRAVGALVLPEQTDSDLKPVGKVGTGMRWS